MIRVYRIRTCPQAPRIALKSEASSTEGLIPFDGKVMDPEQVADGLQVVAEPASNLYQFYSLDEGILVLRSEAVEDCEDLYYTGYLGNQILTLQDSGRRFAGLNVVEFAPPDPEGKAPCQVDTFFRPVFRIASQDPAHLYCVDGLGDEAVQFKRCYEANGFVGLAFEEVWRSGG